MSSGAVEQQLPCSMSLQTAGHARVHCLQQLLLLLRRVAWQRTTLTTHAPLHTHSIASCMIELSQQSSSSFADEVWRPPQCPTNRKYILLTCIRGTFSHHYLLSFTASQSRIFMCATCNSFPMISNRMTVIVVLGSISFGDQLSLSTLRSERRLLKFCTTFYRPKFLALTLAL